ncbi:MAG: hypothetical protein ACM3WT_05855 [Bacillota bacterium]
MRPGCEMRVLLVFVDGMGIGVEDAAVNPFISAALAGEIPVFCGLFGRFGMIPRDRVKWGDGLIGVPVDATLGFPGIPQSATGQTALLTGENAVAVAGGHVSGHPTPELRALLERRCIYTTLRRSGKRVTFINAYRDESFEMMENGIYPASVSTVAALSASLPLRTVRDLMRRRAVYHDITSEILRDRGYPVEMLSPGDAGAIAAGVAAGYDLSVFEFFLTDKVGHRQDMEGARLALARLDAFLGGVLKAVREAGGGTCVILTSDHGNVEDLSTPEHTRNPVPAVFIGLPVGRSAGPRAAARTEEIASIESIMDVPRVILRLTGVADDCADESTANAGDKGD